MNDREVWDTCLRESLSDGRFSRGEKREIKAFIAETKPNRETLAFMRHRVFEIAKEEAEKHSTGELIEWIEATNKLLLPKPEGNRSEMARTFFSPDDDCPREIIRLFRTARARVDVCVFTLTDDRIARALEEAVERGVKVRVITDDDKAHDRGSDAIRLARSGIDVRMDRTDAHMHHKFALFDNRYLLTGSYNWTRSAARENEENFIVTDDARLVDSFTSQFEKLWEKFA